MTIRLKCQGCHRPLKHPTPTGYGPVCARRLGLTPPTSRRPAGRPTRRPRPAAVPPAPDALPGQTELDLYFHQPTLESL